MESYDVTIIAEKHSVAKAFAQALSSGNYKVFSLNNVPIYEFKYKNLNCASLGVSGHIMDFDFPRKYNNWRAVDPRELFRIQPIQVIRKESRKFIRVIGELSKRSKTILLALDSDVEGESIAFEIMRIARRYNPLVEFRRAWFSTITREELKRAFERPRMPDEKLANKAFARMIADLTIGAAFTRALTLMVENEEKVLPRGKFLSYGPCQTPVLFLVVKRAIEREKFKKEKYYTLEVQVKVNGCILKARIKDGKIKSKDKAKEIYLLVSKAKTGKVVKAEYKDTLQRPPEPLNTIELERRASTFLNIRPKEALDIAEELYREGLISYPRTETTIYPPSLNLREIASLFISRDDLSLYVKNILKKTKIEPTKGKEDDKAHPPIYPLRNVKKDMVKEKFGEKGWKLYDFIVRHFLATLSDPALLELQRIEISVSNILFIVEGKKIVDEGYLKVYHYEKPAERPLPYVLEGDIVEINKVNLLEKETSPPPYLSESELLRLMKRYGIGTDATMQDHIQTNIERNYFKVIKKRCIPTPLGKALATSLYDVVPEVVVPEVRGRMERELAKIAKGLSDPEDVVMSIKEEFLGYFDKLTKRKSVISKKLIEALREVYRNDDREDTRIKKGR